MKIITMYLPQFHRVKENDEWWGDGFTDWTAAKHAEPLHPGHYQPHVPLDNNYYDLLDKKTMQWQADLMARYGVDVQCFYHYWFKDGRRILEKPAENLLQWKNINMPFCFCWANDSWGRTWNRLGGINFWVQTSEQGSEKPNTDLLLEQAYGQEAQWREHFEYLLPFFTDERYLKIGNKPVFVFYKTALIPCLGDMVQKWNEWAMENGFDGIYLIGANSSHNITEHLDAVLYHEPTHIFEMYREKTLPLFLEYGEVWEAILSYRDYREKAIYGGLVGYDDSPRRGKKGRIVENSDPERFRVYLAELIAKNIAHNNDLIFLNAWNEWGEGMHLEPDEKYGYGYLEAVRYAREHYTEYLEKYQNNCSEEVLALKKGMDFWAKKCARYEGYWRALDAWLFLKEDGMSVARLLQDRGIQRIAIYGMGMLGKHLLEELRDTEIQIEYLVDKSAMSFHPDIRTYAPDEELPETEAIISTRAYEFSSVRAKLEQQGRKNVISLEQMLLDAVQ